MSNFVVINKKFIEAKFATISINDRAFLFGDGIFETCKIFNGRIYDFQSHKERIKRGIQALKITAEISDLEKLSLQLISKNRIKNGILKIEISRGEGGFGYAPDLSVKPLIIIKTLPEKKISDKISLTVSSIKKTPNSCAPIDCKTKQSLPYILTKIAANEKGFFDGVMLSQHNFISETSSANIFWIKDGDCFTPSKKCDILPGTIRQKILEISPVKIFEVEENISSLLNADEIFLTNSAHLVLPVEEIEIDGKVKKLHQNFGEMLLTLLKKDVEESCKN